MYNNGFPVSYQQLYPQYQYQAPQYQQMQQVQNQQGMTPPIVHADIVQIQDEKEGENYPVAAGSSQMMITRDETKILVKTAYPNGQSNVQIYDKRPPAPPEKKIDMADYVTWEKLEERLAGLASKEDKA